MHARRSAEPLEHLRQLVVDRVDEVDPSRRTARAGDRRGRVPAGRGRCPTSSASGHASSRASPWPPIPSVASTTTAPGAASAGASRATQRSRRTGTCRSRASAPEPVISTLLVPGANRAMHDVRVGWWITGRAGAAVASCRRGRGRVAVDDSPGGQVPIRPPFDGLTPGKVRQDVAGGWRPHHRACGAGPDGRRRGTGVVQPAAGLSDGQTGQNRPGTTSSVCSANACS